MERTEYHHHVYHDFLVGWLVVVVLDQIGTAHPPPIIGISVCSERGAETCSITQLNKVSSFNFKQIINVSC